MRGNGPLMKLRSTLAPFAMLATLMVPGIARSPRFGGDFHDGFDGGFHGRFRGFGVGFWPG